MMSGSVEIPKCQVQRAPSLSLPPHRRCFVAQPTSGIVASVQRLSRRNRNKVDSTLNSMAEPGKRLLVRALRPRDSLDDFHSNERVGRRRPAHNHLLPRFHPLSLPIPARARQAARNEGSSRVVWVRAAPRSARRLAQQLVDLGNLIRLCRRTDSIRRSPLRTTPPRPALRKETRHPALNEQLDPIRSTRLSVTLASTVDSRARTQRALSVSPPGRRASEDRTRGTTLLICTAVLSRRISRIRETRREIGRIAGEEEMAVRVLRRPTRSRTDERGRRGEVEMLPLMRGSLPE